MLASENSLQILAYYDRNACHDGCTFAYGICMCIYVYMIS